MRKKTVLKLLESERKARLGEDERLRAYMNALKSAMIEAVKTGDKQIEELTGRIKFVDHKLKLVDAALKKKIAYIEKIIEVDSKMSIFMDSELHERINIAGKRIDNVARGRGRGRGKKGKNINRNNLDYTWKGVF